MLPPQDVIKWVFEQNQQTITTTSFGNRSAVLLHMIHLINPKAIILWLDTQFNTLATLEFKKELCNRLNLNIVSYTGELWIDNIPEYNTSEYQLFVDQIKIIPFRKAINQLQPKYWISGIRRSDTEFRKTVQTIDKQGHIIKVSPLLEMTDTDMDQYLEDNNLPNEANYFDPTKPDYCECGLHTTNFNME